VSKDTEESEKRYFLLDPPETSRDLEITQLIFHIVRYVRNNKLNRITRLFDIHKFLMIQGVTAEIKAEILSRFSNLMLTYKLDPVNQFTDEIKGLISDFIPQDNSTQPEGLQCIEGIKPEDLKFIFSKLKAGKLHKSVTETNFVVTFQAGALPKGWIPVKWTGSNPELATLINQLTGLQPVPLLVNKYFIPDTKYDSQKTNKIDNKPIIEMIRIALLKLK
jgi:hypothetical protein